MTLSPGAGAPQPPTGYPTQTELYGPPVEAFSVSENDWQDALQFVMSQNQVTPDSISEALDLHEQESTAIFEELQEIGVVTKIKIDPLDKDVSFHDTARFGGFMVLVKPNGDGRELKLKSGSEEAALAASRQGITGFTALKDVLFPGRPAHRRRLAAHRAIAKKQEGELVTPEAGIAFYEAKLKGEHARPQPAPHMSTKKENLAYNELFDERIGLPISEFDVDGNLVRSTRTFVPSWMDGSEVAPWERRTSLSIVPEAEAPYRRNRVEPIKPTKRAPVTPDELDAFDKDIEGPISQAVIDAKRDKASRGEPWVRDDYQEVSTAKRRELIRDFIQPTGTPEEQEQAIDDYAKRLARRRNDRDRAAGRRR